MNQEHHSQDINKNTTTDHSLVFLQLIKNKKDVSSLLKDGFTYTQIAVSLSNFHKSHLVTTDSDNNLVLTEEGNSILSNFYVQRRKILNNSWVEPLSSKKVEKEPLSTVILPRRRKFKF